MKALLYMAAGSTAVCSAVGHNLEVIQSGVNGLLATSENEWVEALSRASASEILEALPSPISFASPRHVKRSTHLRVPVAATIK